MRKNVKTYVLLGLVLIIWGIIGYKVVKSLSPDEDPLPTSKPFAFTPKPLAVKDTFRLMANYRDPFLGTLPQSERKPSKQQVAKQPVQKKNIVYSGSVAQTGDSKTLFFVTIDGRQHLMSKNEKADGVKLVTGNGEEIQVRYGGITETILRSQ